MLVVPCAGAEAIAMLACGPPLIEADRSIRVPPLL